MPGYLKEMIGSSQEKVKIRMKYFIYIIPAFALLWSACNSQKNMANEFTGLNNKMDSVSYAVGVRLGVNSMQQNFSDLNNEEVHKAFDQACASEEMKFDRQQANDIVRKYMNDLKAKKQEGMDIDATTFERASFRDSVSYALGLTLGESTLQQRFGDLKAVAVHKGFDDGFSKTELFDLTQADKILQARQREIKEKDKIMNKEKGLAFLAENGKKEGITTTSSGLQYKVVSQGDGIKPLASDEVKVHYTGTLIDGTKFDSSVDRGEPITFPLSGVIPGWTEGVQLMNQGSKFQFYIPSELAYGERGAGGVIGPNSTLIFDVELLEVIKKEPPLPSKMGPSDPPDFVSFEDNKNKPGVIETESGLQYKVLSPADGPKPKAADKVTCHYTGMLVDGTKFDSSLDRGRPSEFGLRQVIRGWTEGLQYMSPGAIYRFYIPYELGYGAQGKPPRIPQEATLIFDVELLKIN